MELKGKTAVVVGGGGGVGRGLALGLAAKEMNVMVADIDGDAAAVVARELTASGARGVSQQVDATKVDSLSRLVDATVGQFASLDVLVTTVGVILDRKLVEATEEEWAWFFDFNIMSIVRTINTFLPALRERDTSHIVVTSSSAGLLALGPDIVGGIHNGLYTTTKHALIGYADMLRQELAPEGIGVSVLCPGLVDGNLAVTSARNRPERFGGSYTPTVSGRAKMATPAMPAEDVGPIVASGIEANRFYIFTHPDASLVKRRHQQVLADYAFYGPS